MREAYRHLDWKRTSWPGVELAFLESFEDGSARVLIHMQPQSSYPAHRHLGEEQVFVVAGSYEDEQDRYTAGSFHRFPGGSTHAPRAGAEGALLLAWAEGGIELLEPSGGGG